MYLTEMFHHIVTLSLLGSILVIGLLLIKTLLRKKLSANLQYYLWLLLFIRLIIPFTPSTPLNLFNYIPQSQGVSEIAQISIPSINQETSSKIEGNKSIVTTSNEIMPSNEGNNQLKLQNERSWINWHTLALAWIIGAAAALLYIIYINLRLLFKNRKLPVCLSEDILSIVQKCKAELKLNSTVTVVYGDSLKSPGTFGILHPRIIISPEIIEKLSPEELSYIILHELSHVKRRDVLVNSILLCIQVAYWFNPLTWYAFTQVKQDCELACDALALATLKPEEKKNYGHTIISLLEMLSEPYWAPGTLSFVRKFNKRRIIMMSSSKKTSLKWIITALSLALLVGCSSVNSPINPTNSNKNQTSSTTGSNTNTNPNSNNSTTTGSNSILYKNTQYGFNFVLPKSWQGFSIVTTTWQGNDVATGKVTEKGPMISIRHPKWTSKNPMQDIPILIFTLDQWNLLQKEKFHIGAAPIEPTELGRNNVYVFALPARYNYAFPTGYKEVEQILNNHPLQPTEINQSNDSKAALLLNMMSLAKQGKVINCTFAVKTTTIDAVINSWGQPNETTYIAAAKGTYATFTNHNVVFGYNKGEQIFEVRSFDGQLKNLSLAKVKEVFGTPAYDAKTSSQEIIGYTAGSEFKIEMVFNLPTKNNPNPVIDHYNVLYPNGTINSMAGDPGRKW